MDSIALPARKDQQSLDGYVLVHLRSLELQARRLIAFDAEQAQRRVEQIATAQRAAHVPKPAFERVRWLIPYAVLVLALGASGFVFGTLMRLLYVE